MSSYSTIIRTMKGSRVELHVVGVSINDCSLDVLERCVKTAIHALSDFFANRRNGYGVGILSTCNRFEIYSLAQEDVVDSFKEIFFNAGVDSNTLFIASGENASIINNLLFLGKYLRVSALIIWFGADVTDTTTSTPVIISWRHILLPGLAFKPLHQEIVSSNGYPFLLSPPSSITTSPESLLETHNLSSS